MKNFKLQLLIILVILFTYNSCKKDDVNDNSSTSNASQYFGNGISVSAKGRVLDANGHAVIGAIVKGGASSDTTDIMGVFQLSSFAAYENLGCVTVEKPGYFKGVRSFVPKSGGNELLIRLLTKSNNGTINSVSGGIVTAPSIKLTLPANGVQLNNAAYNGTVNVAIKHINPTSATFFEEMPGSLVGVDSNGTSVLTSYGMVGVELTDNNGQKLQIANGKTAEVRFVVPASLLSSAPATIDLWSLDEVHGYWKKEGTATLVNNEYVAQVSHFSFWNCDVPSNFVNIYGRIIQGPNQLPVPGLQVEISSANFGTAWDFTNCQGEYSGSVPKGEVLGISLTAQCAGSSFVVYTGTIGPFNANAVINPISINFPSLTVISGTLLDCNNQPMLNSYAYLNGQVIFPNNGKYNTLVCGNSVMISSFGYNPWVLGQSQNVTLNGGVQNVDLQICGGVSSMSDIDGNIYTTVVIGSQEWMQQNLKTLHYSNGAVIPSGLTDSVSWTSTTSGACIDYNNNPANTAVYGKLYNWYAVADPSGLCPVGWHVPEDWEWNVLVKYIDPSADTNCLSCTQSVIAGSALKEIGLSHWDSPNSDASNTSGFTALPSGLRNNWSAYIGLGEMVYWWSSSRVSSTGVVSRNINAYSGAINRNDVSELNGYSVRCVKD